MRLDKQPCISQGTYTSRECYHAAASFEQVEGVPLLHADPLALMHWLSQTWTAESTPVQGMVREILTMSL